MRSLAKPGDVIDGFELAHILNAAVDINESGETIFVASFVDTDGLTKRGIFSQHRAIAREGEVVNGFELVGFTTGPGCINESGDVAFFGVFLDSTTTGGIFFAPGPSTGGDPILLARVGTEVEGGGTLTSVGGPAIDDAANVVFRGVAGNRHRLFSTSPTTTIPVEVVGPGDVIGGISIDGIFPLQPLLTGDGALRFVTNVGFPSATRSAIFSSIELLRQGGDILDGRLLASFFDDPSLNGGGEIAFKTNFTDQTTGMPGRGLFTTQKLLAAVGDVVDGETIQGFVGGRASLLDDGQAFYAAGLVTGERALLSLNEVLVRTGDLVELQQGVEEPLVAVQQVAANDSGRIHILGFIDSLQEVLVEVLPADADGDGVPDDEDECLDSDTSETVVIDGCDSGAANLLGDNGCSISDGIALCGDAADNHGQFQSCVGDLAQDLMNAGVLTGSERGAIQSCGAQAAIPEPFLGR
jgi:hypothetical protein